MNYPGINNTIYDLIADHSGHAPFRYMKASRPSWDRWVPASHPLDKRLCEYGSQVDADGVVTLKEEFRLPPFYDSDTQAFRTLMNKERIHQGFYTYKGFLNYLRGLQVDDLYTSRIFGDRIPSSTIAGEYQIPRIRNVSIVGSTVREMLEMSGYLHRVRSEIAETSLKREDRLYRCHDYDVRVYFQGGDEKKFDAINRFAIEFFRGTIGSQAIEFHKAGGWWDRLTQYKMIPILEKDDRPTEWIFILSLAIESMCSEDSLQVSFENINRRDIRVFLKGDQQSVCQAAVDSDCMIQRYPHPESLNEAAWAKLIVNRSLGKILSFYTGQSKDVEKILLSKSIQSGRLIKKLWGALKDSPDHQFAIFFHAALSLLSHAEIDPHSIIEHIWSLCFETHGRGCFTHPAINWMYQNLKKGKLDFQELVVCMQVYAFCQSSQKGYDVTVRKDGGEPVFYIHLEPNLSLSIPMFSSETLAEFGRITMEKKVSLNSLFSLSPSRQIDPFFTEFSDEICWNEIYNMGYACIKTPAASLTGLLLCHICQHSEKVHVRYPIVEAPEILQTANPGDRPSIWSLIQSTHDEVIDVDLKGDIINQFVISRMASSVNPFFVWSGAVWNDFSTEKKMQLLPQMIEQLLKAAQKDLAVQIIRLMSYEANPDDYISLLLSFCTQYPDFQPCLLERLVDFCQRKEVSLPKVRGLIRDHMSSKQRWIKETIDYLIQTGWEDDFEATAYLAFEAVHIGWISPEICAQGLMVQSNRQQSLWISLLDVIDERWSTNLLIEVAHHLKSKSSLKSAYIRVIEKLLYRLGSGETIDSDHIQWVADESLALIEEERSKDLKSQWSDFVPYLLQTLDYADQDMMVRYWKLASTISDRVSHSAAKFVDKFQESYNEDLEKLLLSSFSSLDMAAKKTVIIASLKQHLKVGDKKRVLEICQIGQKVLKGRVAETKRYVKYGGLEEARLVLEEMMTSREAWTSLLTKLQTDGKWGAIHAILNHVKPLKLDPEFLENLIMSMLKFQTSSMTLEQVNDLWKLAQNNGLMTSDLETEFARYVVHHQGDGRKCLPLAKKIWNRMIAPISYRKGLNADGVSILMELMAKLEPSIYWSYLKKDTVMARFRDQNLENKFWFFAIKSFESLSASDQITALQSATGAIKTTSEEVLKDVICKLIEFSNRHQKTSNLLASLCVLANLMDFPAEDIAKLLNHLVLDLEPEDPRSLGLIFLASNLVDFSNPKSPGFKPVKNFDTAAFLNKVYPFVHDKDQEVLDKMSESYGGPVELMFEAFFFEAINNENTIEEPFKNTIVDFFEDCHLFERHKGIFSRFLARFFKDEKPSNDKWRLLIHIFTRLATDPELKAEYPVEKYLLELKDVYHAMRGEIDRATKLEFYLFFVNLAVNSAMSESFNEFHLLQNVVIPLMTQDENLMMLSSFFSCTVSARAQFSCVEIGGPRGQIVTKLLMSQILKSQNLIQKEIDQLLKTALVKDDFITRDFKAYVGIIETRENVDVEDLIKWHSIFASQFTAYKEHIDDELLVKYFGVWIKSGYVEFEKNHSIETMNRIEAFLFEGEKDRSSREFSLFAYRFFDVYVSNIFVPRPVRLYPDYLHKGLQELLVEYAECLLSKDEGMNRYDLALVGSLINFVESLKLSDSHFSQMFQNMYTHSIECIFITEDIKRLREKFFPRFENEYLEFLKSGWEGLQKNRFHYLLPFSYHPQYPSLFSYFRDFDYASVEADSPEKRKTAVEELVIVYAGTGIDLFNSPLMNSEDLNLEQKKDIATDHLGWLLSMCLEKDAPIYKYGLGLFSRISSWIQFQDFEPGQKESMTSMMMTFLENAVTCLLSEKTVPTLTFDLIQDFASLKLPGDHSSIVFKLMTQYLRKMSQVNTKRFQKEVNSLVNSENIKSSPSFKACVVQALENLSKKGLRRGEKRWVLKMRSKALS